MILGMKLPVEYGLDGVHRIFKAGFGAIQVSVPPPFHCIPSIPAPFSDCVFGLCTDGLDLSV